MISPLLAPEQEIERRREAKREASRRWAAANPGKARAKSREACRRARAKDAAKVNEAQRKWNAANRERSRAAVQRWRSKPENQERHRQTSLKWAAENPAKALALGAMRRARKKQATVGDLKAIAAIYEKARSVVRVRCAYCGRYPKVGDRHVDHVVPLSRGGTHSVDNLAIACARCNLAKHTKTEEEFRWRATARS